MNNESLQYLINKTNQSKVDYEGIKQKCVTFLNDQVDDCYVNFIITARGRLNFTESLWESFEEARKAFDKKVCFTIVEHSQVPEHSKFYRKKQANYVFLNSPNGEMFNKCLSYNLGVLFSSPSKYYLFHDLDILVQKDFFKKVFENLGGSSAIQCYTKRRVLNCDVDVTNKIMTKQVDINTLSEDVTGVNLPMYGGKPALGSKGGSILVKSELLFDIGGFDPELFKAYSAEDNFFWEKVSAMTDIKYADNPSIEMFHMWHEPQFNKNPFLHEMERDYLIFKESDLETKKEYIKFKKELFRK